MQYYLLNGMQINLLLLLVRNVSYTGSEIFLYQWLMHAIMVLFLEGVFCRLNFPAKLSAMEHQHHLVLTKCPKIL